MKAIGTFERTLIPIVFPAWTATLTAEQLADMNGQFEEIELRQSGDGFQIAEQQISFLDRTWDGRGGTLYRPDHTKVKGNSLRRSIMKTPEKHVGTTAKRAEMKSFMKPDEIRKFPKGRVELVTIGGATVGRAIFEPGWKWSESIQPIAKTKSCEAPHFQYHVSGVIKVRMDDGTEFECHPGDVSLLPCGHDAWVVGKEPAVIVDFQGMVDYAKAL